MKYGTVVIGVLIGICVGAGSVRGEVAGNISTTGSLPLIRQTIAFPSPDEVFTRQIETLVEEAGLHEMTPATDNPDDEDEWSSICVIDLSSSAGARLGGWKMTNFVYPASTYKMYVLGELIRQVCAGERSLDDVIEIAPHNMRDKSQYAQQTTTTLAETLRFMIAYSDNTAANVAIDVADRKRVSAMLLALGCHGSEVTRKFLPRTREDAEFTSAPGTMSSALHQARFLWAVEHGGLGGGRGRGLIKGYLSTNVQNTERVRAGVPETATVYSKTGEWNTFTSEAALVEDGEVRYIVCIMTAMPHAKAAPRMAKFVKSVHQLLTK